MAKSELFTACRPSLPITPTPMSAAWALPTVRHQADPPCAVLLLGEFQAEVRKGESSVRATVKFADSRSTPARGT